MSVVQVKLKVHFTANPPQTVISEYSSATRHVSREGNSPYFELEHSHGATTLSTHTYTVAADCIRFMLFFPHLSLIVFQRHSGKHRESQNERKVGRRRLKEKKTTQKAHRLHHKKGLRRIT